MGTALKHFWPTYTLLYDLSGKFAICELSDFILYFCLKEIHELTLQNSPNRALPLAPYHPTIVTKHLVTTWVILRSMMFAQHNCFSLPTFIPGFPGTPSEPSLPEPPCKTKASNLKTLKSLLGLAEEEKKKRRRCYGVKFCDNTCDDPGNPGFPSGPWKIKIK